MRGTIAIWCDPGPSSAENADPQLELHFNIWRDLPGRAADVFDFGIQIADPRRFQRLFISIPAVIEKSQISDLSEVLKDLSTLKAVFNEIASIGIQDTQKKSFEVTLLGQEAPFQICKVDENDLDITYLPSTTDRQETIVTLTNSFFERHRNGRGEHYVRLRIALDGELSSLFVSDIEPSDRIFISSFYKTQTIEFRLNERRNFSDSLRATYPDMRIPRITAVHYFLIRDIRGETLEAYPAIRKVRRLEPGLWDKYLADMGTLNPHDMVIFHWRVMAQAQDPPFKDFVALATFRKPKLNVLLFTVAVILLGAGGSAMQTLTSAFFAPVVLSQNATVGEIVIQQVLVILTVAGSLLALLALVSRAHRKKQRP